MGEIHREFGCIDGPDRATRVSLGIEFVQDRERFPPEPLSAKEPVAEFVVDRRPAETGRLEVAADPLKELAGGEARVRPRVHGPAVAGEEFTRLRGAVRWLDDRDHIESEGLRELEIAVVVGRHRHDGAGAVGGEDVVCHPDRHGPPRERVDHVRTGKHARLLAGQISAVEVALAGGRLAIGGDRLPLLWGGEYVEQRMLRGHDHVGHAVEGVGASGVDPQDVTARLFREARRRPCLLPGVEAAAGRRGRGDQEVDFGAGASPDPIALQLFDAGGPVESLEFALQTVGVGGDPQHPLPQRNPHHGVPSPLADAADHFLVGQHRAERRAPVHRGLRLVGEAVAVAILRDRGLAVCGNVGRDRQFGDRAALLDGRVEPAVEQDEEDPLRPTDVLGICRRQHAVPVVAEAEHLQLSGERRDVLLGALPRRRAGADRMLLGGEAEGVEAHRMHHARAPHPFEPRHDVGGGVALRVADMQAVAAWVREHVEDVSLAARWQAGRGERVVRVPPFLPLWLDPRRLVPWHPALVSLGNVGSRDERRPASAGYRHWAPSTGFLAGLADVPRF